MTAPPIDAALRPLLAFAVAVLHEHQQGMGDVDGGWLQDKATELGVLVGVEVTAPCGDDCICAEYGFPCICYRYSDTTNAVRLALEDT